MTREQRFFDALRDVFVGAKVEGKSGYINLMRIKSRYYTEGVFPRLQQDINEALKPFPGFRDELFEKLYDFFHRYFSESGSIYFRYTPLHQNVYEKVYTDDKDVMLFWKTHMLYYVKTDRLFKSLEVEIEGQKFFFDVSTLEHKKANEKRDIVYTFKEKRKDSALTFTVSYSEKGKKTKTGDILRELRKNGDKIGEDTLERAFRVFEKQSEVDYFINKDAQAFLEEQFNLWLYQYVFAGVSEWTETRIKQLQTLKDIAFKIIAFISQFEDELVRIWNKPKFVLNSNYVITLDRIAEKEGGIALVQELVAHKNFKAQVEEWQQLGIVDKSFKKTDVLEKDLMGKRVAKSCLYLPVDTKHFKEVELEILALFDSLDASLDGWLIKSENYQALNTILPKFRERVGMIYIDPPFNKQQDADYLYNVKYKDSTWITLLENRLRIARQLLAEAGSLYLKCDYNGNMCARLLLNEVFGGDKFLSELQWKRRTSTQVQYHSFAIMTDTIYCYAKTDDWIYHQQFQKYSAKYEESQFKHEDKKGKYLIRNFYSAGDGPARVFFGKSIAPPEGHHWRYKQERIDELTGKGAIILDSKGFPKLKQYIQEMRGKPFDNLLTDIHVVQGSSKEFNGFPTQNPEKLLKLFIQSSSDEGDLVLDFFLGSGTTTAAAQKTKHKWLGVEFGEHFDTTIVPRMKEILAGSGNHEPAGISEDVNWRGGGFFKYCELEQYEDTLRRMKYADADLFDDPNKDPFHQYVFLRDPKMLEVLAVDAKKNTVNLDLSKLYDHIDIAETLSNLTGKWINRITADSVEFEDGEVMDTKDPDWKRIKSLIWW